MKLKVIRNKANNQLIVALSRRKLKIKKKMPKFIDIQKIKFEY